MKNLVRFNTLLIIFLAAQMMHAQTTAFNYQGKLTDAGAPQATYQMQFRLYDQAVGGSQIGNAVERPSVAVEQGVFSVLLDFGANAFTGADRFLEISVRRNAGENYTILNPRQQIASSPYSIRTLSAQQADLALNSNQLGGVNASEYVTNSTVGSSFIRNGTTPQTANMNISGNALVGGLVGLGTNANPNFRLDSFGSMRALSNASAHFVAETNGGTNTWARTYWRSPSRSWFMGTSQNFNGNQLYISDETANQTRMVISTNGFVGIGTTNPSLISGGSGRLLEIADASSPGLAIRNTSAGGGQYFLYSRLDAGGHSLRIFDATSNADRFVLHNNGNVGIGNILPTAKLEVAGTTKTNILQVTGGSDLAENFEMADAGVKPGMIVAIDPDNAGKLVLARGAYNRQVAGVVSGANNLSAGMILPDLQESENSLPVALSGRVWVYADATNNPIKAGDLLTTSDTPGYAMKVTKYKKAQGAIIGKAMTELESGTGLVLVLVSLQ